MHLILLAVRLLLGGLFLIAAGSKLLGGLANSRKIAGGLWPRLFR